MRKATITMGMLGLAIVGLVGCNKTDTSIDTNSSKKTPIKSEVTAVPIATRAPLDDVDLKMYFDQDYKVSAFHIWSNEAIPTGIIVLAKSTEIAHANGAQVSAILVKYQESQFDYAKKWRIVNETRLQDEIGSFGEMRDAPMFIKIGPNNYGFFVNGGSSGQGMSMYSTEIYGIVNGNFAKIANIETHEDNFGAVGEEDKSSYSQDSNIFILIDPRKEVYDLKVQTIFHRNLSKEKPTSEKQSEEIYIFKNGQYMSNEQQANATSL